MFKNCLCSKCVKTYKKFVLCLKLRSVGYTTDCKGALEVCDVILGVQSSVTKCDEGGEVIFFPKIA